jgi:hypothetical protein
VLELTRPLAVLLSLFMVSTSASGIACDLSCSLGRMHFDCAMATSPMMQTGAADSMSSEMEMGNMEMGSGISVRPTQPILVMNPPSGHAETMYSHLSMAELWEPMSGLAPSDTSDRSEPLVSCTLESCSQISASASPPGADHSVPSFLNGETIHLSTRITLSIWTEVPSVVTSETPPPVILSGVQLLTALRI